MKFIGHTHVGQVRQGNEDAYGFDQSRQVGVLADGMGGLNAGEVASAQAVDAFLDALPGLSDEANMTRAIAAANARVYGLAHANSEWNNMGTTLVACALMPSNHWVVGHVGDSRAYLCRAGRLRAVTKDHSVVQELLDQGVLSAAEARVAANRHIITRAIGLEANVQSDVVAMPALPGDLVLLCSDGLSDLVNDDQIVEILAAHESLEVAADQLVGAANRAGGVDNITVVLISA